MPESIRIVNTNMNSQREGKTMSPFDSNPEVNTLQDIAFMVHVKQHLPFYWPENIDREGRHTNPRFGGHVDFDFCDICKQFWGVDYWYGGYSVSDKGTVVPNEQVPLCEECARKELS
jgi:hypothetical protein